MNLIETVKKWREETISMYASCAFSSRLVHRGDPVDGEDRKLRARGGEVPSATITLAGWWDAAYRDRNKEGRSRMSCAILFNRHPSLPANW